VPSSSIVQAEAVRDRAEMDTLSRDLESAQAALKDNDRSLRKQLAELKLQSEQLTLQLDYERHPDRDQEDADDEDEEEASSEISFQQTWPRTTPVGAQTGKGQSSRGTPGTPRATDASGSFGAPTRASKHGGTRA
jgi:hypothetical protein